MGQLEDLMEMKLCDNIFSSSKKENQKSGRNKCVVNEGEKERFRKKCWENKRKKKGREGGRREGKKEGGKKKQEEEWKIKLCYSVSLITQKVKSIYCDQWNYTKTCKRKS